MMLKTSKASKGFTLIELAIVIAIISILAVTAAMRMGGNTGAASRASAYATYNELNSGYALYLARTLSEPTDFTDFVDTDGTISGNETISFATTHPCNGGDQGGFGAGSVAATAITCSFADLSAAVVYTLDATTGAITHNIDGLTF